MVECIAMRRHAPTNYRRRHHGRLRASNAHDDRRGPRRAGAIAMVEPANDGAKERVQRWFNRSEMASAHLPDWSYPETSARRTRMEYGDRRWRPICLETKGLQAYSAQISSARNNIRDCGGPIAIPAASIKVVVTGKRTHRRYEVLVQHTAEEISQPDGCCGITSNEGFSTTRPRILGGRRPQFERR